MPETADAALTEVTAHWQAIEMSLAQQLTDVRATAGLLIEAERADLAQKTLTQFSAQALMVVLQDAEALSAP